ncbi:phospholipid-binding lipoprotein MlaA [Methylohalomonas lacus]|uniref:Phospholipid-binding lipoprotein MlaA n=1 Tax=Methylohalomonas lacus TaxID=398773 RepID=A0AAE3HKY1_9GAMM|nr:VacJ family lipoprotein [Methylohalomonas lacus]MCS3902327.1 phospholipid-binding lipoprotein MlaA [Methylohalomonas lacus]
MRRVRPGNLAGALLIAFSLALSGCASLHDNGEANSDPLEPANRAFYTFNDTLDNALIRPTAEFYVFATPAPVRASVANFFTNLGSINVILNAFLQGKVDAGFAGLSRFFVNSTIGLGGLFDVATEAGMKRHEEDLGQTLAIWGIDPGPYLYLPLLGPYSTRHTPDLASSTLTNPLFYVSGSILYPVAALGLISKRAEHLEATRMRDEAAVDAYIFTREAYLQRRSNLIHDGDPPTTGYDDLFGDIPAAQPGASQ